MIQNLEEPVTVYLKSDATLKKAQPVRIIWQQKTYDVLETTFHSKYYHGRTLLHEYAVLTTSLLFILRLDTSSQLWTLTEVADGNAE